MNRQFFMSCHFEAPKVKSEFSMTSAGVQIEPVVEAHLGQTQTDQNDKCWKEI